VNTEFEPPLTDIAEAKRAMDKKLFLSSFSGKRMAFDCIVSKQRKAPYPTFSPDTSPEQYELNELISELGDQGEHGVAQGPASWRSRLVQPGMVVVYKDDPDKVYLAYGGMWATRLWPLVEHQSALGVSYWVQADVRVGADLKMQALLAFADVECLLLQWITPLVWFICNNYLPEYAVVPPDAIFTVRE
jgi:hypothetical protein